jgi:hypothetical protein
MITLMSRFSDLLNNPLPSKAKLMTEGTDDFEKELDKEDASADAPSANDDIEKEGCNSGEECGPNGNCEEDCPVCGNEDFVHHDGEPCPDCGYNDDDDDVNIIDDEDDIDDLSDSELAALDAELSDDIADDIADDGETPVNLTADEEQEADDMMAVAATTALINDEMNKTEKTKFIESAEYVAAAVNEGLLLESDVNELATTLGLVTEANNYNKKMIIRLDKEAKKKQLFAIAVNVSAAAHHDADYVKLKKVNRMRKILRRKLIKKYQAEATRRMKIYFKKLTSSRATPLQKIGQALSRDNK